MEWIREKFGWLRGLFEGLAARPSGEVGEGSFRYPRSPNLNVPPDLKSAVDDSEDSP